MKNKVFGIGLSRTGTTSLTVALLNLGYDAKHYPKALKIMKEAEGHDALTDIPVILAYKELAERYPASKFILTIRDVGSWLDSCQRHWGSKKRRKENKMAMLIRRGVFGRGDYDTITFKKVYKRHLEDVLGYFKGQQERLLVMDICGGDGYEKLCPFLGKDIPGEPFPHRAGGGINYEKKAD